MTTRNRSTADGAFRKAAWFWFALVVCMVLASGVAEASKPRAGDAEPDEQEALETDPWESFNEKMFRFNHEVLDRYFLKPVAKAWDLVLPDPVQRNLRNAVDNTNFVTRLVNSLAQGKFGGAGRVLARVSINTTIGLGGLLMWPEPGLALRGAMRIPARPWGSMG